RGHPAMTDNHNHTPEQAGDHDPEDLYEPYYAMSYPWMGIFGDPHPLPNFIFFGIVLIVGVTMSVLTIPRIISEGLAPLPFLLIMVFGMVPIGLYGLYAAYKRYTWRRRYERITGTKPAFGDPANKPPGYDKR